MLKSKNIPLRQNAPEICSAIFLFSLLMSMATELFTTGIAQKIFYFVGYLSFFFIFYVTIKKRKFFNQVTPVLPFIFALLFIGLVRYVWFIYAKEDISHFSEFDQNNLRNYDLSGKRLLLSVFIIITGLIISKYITRKVLNIGRIIVFLGIIICLLFGIYEFFWVTHDRIKLTADAASSSSYMVLFMYATYLTLSINTGNIKWLLIDALSAIMTFTLLMLCDTRVSILAFIGVTILYCLYNKKIKSFFNNKLSIIIGVGVVIVVISLTGNRWIEGVRNIQNYNTDSSTSLGARVAIWDSGITYAKQHYLFSTPLERTSFAQPFIKEKHPGNTEGYNNVKYNMHNEFLETLTLQGIIGAISLALMYISFIIVAIRQHVLKSAAMPLFVLFVCGLTDSVLINPQAVMLLLISISVSALLPVRDK